MISTTPFGRITRLAIPCAAAALLCIPTTGFAEPILLSAVASFSVLGAAAVTNVGPSTLSASLGVSHNSSNTGITGFLGTLANDGPGTYTGTAHQGDAFAILADNQLVAAMTTLGLMGPGTLLSADLAGLVLAPGVYTVPFAISNLTGALTLDGLGDANALWVFQVTSSLITSPGSSVSVINTGSGAGVGLYWNVGSSATLDTTTTFAGNILASTSITMNNGVTLNCGRALAHTGLVSMINDRISSGCAGNGSEDGGDTGTGGPGGTTPVPEPATVTLFGSALVAAAMWTRRRRGFFQP